jgi:hypothetical protein
LRLTEPQPCGDMQCEQVSCTKRHPVLSNFPYVCLEPVLVKRSSFFWYKIAVNDLFYYKIRTTVRDAVGPAPTVRL